MIGSDENSAGPGVLPDLECIDKRSARGVPRSFPQSFRYMLYPPLQVTPGSLAARCGLQAGDTITRIGSTPADSLRHKEAQQRIIDAGNALDLTLER